MKLKMNTYLLGIALLTGLFLFTHVASCTHDDTVPPSGGGGGGDITRGTDHVTMADGATFDKVHSSVNWATPYLGSLGVLTGKFNTFGFNSFSFYEDKPENTSFEAYVWLNSVNTGEPGRDDGCLLGTFGTTDGATDEESNLAVIKSKKVEFSTTDKGYIVTADFTFHGVTKEVTGKLDYIGKTSIGTDVYEYGLQLVFSILAISDFGIESTSIADNVDIKCSGNFKQ
ncbi:MAG TPA: YceI family protein [Parafilimonas sp.]|nr:YceI family protein [Parafilimonas sp.]